ncbi:single-stranded-DNA-specific exonuclease RecJ, partial [candidate division WWE3 bacterium]|nr:single-stranded-DNA-specific exonuclease RecJ [candidate division WWE3 bacterium]
MSAEIEWNIKDTSSPKTTDELIEKLLSMRNITGKTREMFFDTSVTDILDDVIALFNKDDLDTLIGQIKEAIDNNKPIIIHGDYDVDGISGTAILWETIYNELGYELVRPFIPHRAEHGYGVSEESVNDIEKMMRELGGLGLVITVDCGITGKYAIEYGKEKGIAFGVTDHHTVQDDKRPIGVPVLHTYQLCGAGIAWVLSILLKQSMNGSDITDSVVYESGLDLVAMATIADVQSLVGYNRVLVTAGLELLSHTQRAGLKELYKRVDIVDKPIGTYEVGWLIGPRINAMGRLEHGLDSLRLLCTKSEKQAASLADVMNDTNQARQEMTEMAIQTASQKVYQHNWQDDLILVVVDETWHEGILGLIAGKLVERFGVPVIALGPGDGFLKGSARSVSGFNVAEALKENEDLLLQAGGHEMAAGLSMDQGNVEELRGRLKEKAKEIFGEDKPPKVLTIDLCLSPEVLTIETVSALEKLSPHGVDNPRPLFCINDAVITNKKLLGQTGKH